MRRAVGLADRPGVLVVRTDRAGAAARAGVERGDLITGAGGREVRTVADLDRALHAAVEKIELTLERGAEPLALAVALA
jgi:S1-C subfamily serine protease